MSNPLKAKPAASSFTQINEDELIQRCHNLNYGWPFSKLFDRWHYVEPATPEKGATILHVDGITGEEAWTVAKGGKIEYQGWDQDRTDVLMRRLRWLVKRGRV